MGILEWVIIAAGALAAMIVALGVRRHRRTKAKRRAADELFNERTAIVGDLLGGIQRDDAAAFGKLDERIPGLKGTTWREFVNRHYNTCPELYDRMEAVVTGYKERREYETYAGYFSTETAVWEDRSRSTRERIRALRAIYGHWENLGYRSENWGRLAEQFMNQTVAQQHLRDLVQTYALELATAASEGDRSAFWRLYNLRQSVLNPSRYVPDGRFDFYEVGLKWTKVDNWQMLVDQYIAAATEEDLGLNPEVVASVEFVQTVVDVLRTGSRLNAKIVRARLVARPALRAITPQPLVAAIYVYAATGERPQLGLLYATTDAVVDLE